MTAGPNWPGDGPGVNQPGAEGSWGTSRLPSLANPKPTMWVLCTSILGMFSAMGLEPGSTRPRSGPAGSAFVVARAAGDSVGPAGVGRRASDVERSAMESEPGLASGGPEEYKSPVAMSAAPM